MVAAGVAFDTPQRLVQRRLESRLGRVPELPRHYVRFGDVLLLDVPASSVDLSGEIAGAFADALGCRSVLAWEGGIEGEFREPSARLLWGDPDTETVHKERGIQFRFDPARLMWSAGNLPERQRVASWDCRGETVVDLFAGIGYFTLPLAVHARADRVVAVEKNPLAYGYLIENVALNGVRDRVECRQGDNRQVAPEGVAHRVMLGYLHDTPSFLSVALRALRREGGRIHLHAKLPHGDFPDLALETLAPIFQKEGWRAALSGAHRVKSYAPGIVHGVLDLEVRPSGS